MMPSKKLMVRLISSTTALILFFGAIVNREVSAYDFFDWRHGVAGYHDVLMEATEEEKPLVLFFYRDGSKPSQRMTLEYLDSCEVGAFLAGIPKVEINPDREAGEKGLCTKYHVKRFPSFVVLIPGFGERDKRVHPFSKRGDMTPHEFLLAVKRTIASQYNRIGTVCFRDRQYVKAIQYYEKALVFDSENAYAYYGMGISYHSIAYKEKDVEQLKRAEGSYMKALEIDPDHRGSKKELRKLRRVMEKLGIR